MSPTNIVAETRQFLTTDIQNQLPKKLQGLFCFGIRALTLQPLVSCNGNARMSHGGTRAAAEQRMYRLLHHPRLFLLIWRAIAKQITVHDRSLVNVDYSNLGPLAILGFGMQTRRGRALPILMRALASNTQGLQKTHPKYEKLKQSYQTWKKHVQADQFTFVIKSLRLLKYLYDCQPRLVFDRGFVNQGLVQFLCAQSWIFYLRMRSDHHVTHGGERRLVSSFETGEYTVTWTGQRLRLVVGQRRKRDKEPWYILTNDRQTAATKILKYYYHRFEIEESFRDLKSLFKLKGSRLRTWQSLRVVLCFMSLSLVCALHRITTDTFLRLLPVHPKKSLSLIRTWQEGIQKALRTPTLTDWGMG